MKSFFGKNKRNKSNSPVLISSPSKLRPQARMSIHTPSPSLDMVEIEENTKILKDKIIGLDVEINKLELGIKTSKGSLREGYKKKLNDKKNSRLIYEKQIDLLIKKQFTLEQNSFDLSIQGLIKQAIGVRLILDQNRKSEEKEAEFIMEDTKNTLQEVLEVRDRLADYSVDVDEAELDLELQDMCQEINNLPITHKPPWYIQDKDVACVRILTKI